MEKVLLLPRRRNSPTNLFIREASLMKGPNRFSFPTPNNFEKNQAKEREVHFCTRESWLLLAGCTSKPSHHQAPNGKKEEEKLFFETPSLPVRKTARTYARKHTPPLFSISLSFPSCLLDGKREKKGEFTFPYAKLRIRGKNGSSICSVRFLPSRILLFSSFF